MPSEGRGQYSAIIVRVRCKNELTEETCSLSARNETRGCYECVFSEHVAEHSRLSPFLPHPLAIISHVEHLRINTAGKTVNRLFHSILSSSP